MEQALRKSEEKYKGLVNNVRLGIFRSMPGPTGRFLEVNPAMEGITGYSREELLRIKVAVRDGCGHAWDRRLADLRRIRDVSNIPIIMLTGKQMAEDDIVRGLDYGADDYLIKPVGNRELVARVRAVLRRAQLPPSPEAKREITYGDGFLMVDVVERKVIVNGKQVKLTPREFRMLALLVENAGHILTHKQVLEKVWGWEYVDDVDYVRIYISHLRQKIEPDPALPRYIITEPGVGYYFQKAG